MNHQKYRDLSIAILLISLKWNVPISPRGIWRRRDRYKEQSK
jgi:hypothetical protein